MNPAASRLKPSQNGELTSKPGLKAASTHWRITISADCSPIASLTSMS